MSLEGFAKKLAGDERMREKILKDGTLLAWPSAEMVGVTINVDAQRLNSYLLKLVADFWCPQWESPTMIPLDEVKDQVPWFPKA